MHWCVKRALTSSRKLKTLNHTYEANGQLIVRLFKHKYLGVTVNYHLDWKDHILNITASRRSALCILRRNISSVHKVKTRAYQALIRPKLEYTKASRNPLVNEVNLLESGQRQAARLTTTTHCQCYADAATPWMGFPCHIMDLLVSYSLRLLYQPFVTKGCAQIPWVTKLSSLESTTASTHSLWGLFKFGTHFQIYSFLPQQPTSSSLWHYQFWGTRRQHQLTNHFKSQRRPGFLLTCTLTSLKFISVEHLLAWPQSTIS